MQGRGTGGRGGMGGAFGGGGAGLGGFGASPLVVRILVAATAILTILGHVLQRNKVLPLLKLGALLPEEVWRGQLWRLVTWPFFQIDPIGLVFACLVVLWFGSDLARAWGTRRFLAVFFGLAAGVGAVDTLIGRYLWDELFQTPVVGLWPISEALLIAWAVRHPHREIALYFVVPVKGRSLIILTVAGTVLFSLFYGLVSFVPHFLAEAAMLVYMGSLRRAIQSWRGRQEAARRRDGQQYVATVLRFERQEDRDGPPSPRGKPPKWLN